MFGSISNEEILANKGKTYQEATALRDPLAGLGFAEEHIPFEQNAADAWALDYPGQPREKDGRFAEGKLPDSDYDKPSGFAKNQKGEKTLDSAERKRYNNLLLGKQTTDGNTVRALYQHIYDRAAQREISPGEILDCIQKPTITFPGNTGDRIAYQLGDVRAIYQPSTQQLVTVIRLEGERK